MTYPSRRSGDVPGITKGPFKGKGNVAQIAEPGGWDPASPDAAQLPTRKRIVHLATRLATAEARRAACFNKGDRLIHEFKTKYPMPRPTWCATPTARSTTTAGGCPAIPSGGTWACPATRPPSS